MAYRDALGTMGRRLPSDRVRIVPNAADIAAFPEMSRAEARHALGGEYERRLKGKVVGFAGSIRPRHCLEELLQASSCLHKQGLAHWLLIVGDGPVRPRLEELARDLNIHDSVHFIGRVEHHRVGRYLAACDLLYGVVDPKNPSDPIKVYEALAAGRPVLTSSRPQLRFVKEKGFGVLVDGTDPQRIAAALEEGLSMDWTDEDALRARSYIERNHSWHAVAREILGR